MNRHLEQATMQVPDATTSDSPVLFSIIIATYNYASFLPRAIESALAQPRNDYELIVIDDGSTDDTPVVIAPYRDRLIYHRQANLGHCSANNSGVRLAKGKYCYFLDADDEMLANALDLFSAAIDQFGEIPLFFGGYVSVSEDGRERTRRGTPVLANNFAALESFLSKNLVGVKHGSTIVHRSVFEEIGYQPAVRNNTDIVFLGQVLARYRAVGIQEPVFKSNAHPGRGRGNHRVAMEAGLSVIDALFDERYIPAALMPLRKTYYERRALSLSRTLYKAGDYPGSKRYFALAVRSSPALLLQFRYLRRYFLCFTKYHLDNLTAIINPARI